MLGHPEFPKMQRPLISCRRCATDWLCFFGRLLLGLKPDRFDVLLSAAENGDRFVLPAPWRELLDWLSHRISHMNAFTTPD